MQKRKINIFFVIMIILSFLVANIIPALNTSRETAPEHPIHQLISNLGSARNLPFECPDSPTWQWAVSAEGTDVQYGTSSAVDTLGDTYVLGTYAGTVIFGNFSLTSQGVYNVFVAKLSPNGTWLWAKSAGGIDSTYSSHIALDAEGNAYIIGFFNGTAMFGTTILTSLGLCDIFIAKLTPDGMWQWAVSSGNVTNDEGHGIAVDGDGNVYVSGYGPFLIAKLNNDGSWIWSILANGGSCLGKDIDVDAAGNLYLTGEFLGTTLFGNTTLVSNGGESDIFIAKLSPSETWQWAVRAGGNKSDMGKAIAIDEENNVYVTGMFSRTTTFGNITLTNRGYYDVFLTKLSSTGVWLWAVSAGGEGYEESKGIALDAAHGVYVTGLFSGEASFGETNLTSQGTYDAFLTKVSVCGCWQWAVNAQGTSYTRGYGVSADLVGNAYITGSYSGMVTFGNTSLSSNSTESVFVAKCSSFQIEKAVIIGLISNLQNINRYYCFHPLLLFKIPSCHLVKAEKIFVKDGYHGILKPFVVLAAGEVIIPWMYCHNE